MTLIIDLPQSLVNRLQVEAARKGMTLEDYARLLLEDQLLHTLEPPFWATATPQEWLQGFNAWMDSHDPTLPPLPDEAISRESFYGERE